MDLPKRLEAVKRWYTWNLPTISDEAKRAEFQRRCLEQFLMLFVVMLNDFRKLKGQNPELERPYWQSLELPTFVDKQPENTEDPELGVRG